MNAPAMARLLAHWEVRRQMALAAADSATRNGRPALAHLRESSRCEAGFNKLARLLARAAKPRRSAAA